MDPSEYAWMSATDLVKALQSKQLSPVDLIDAAIARIEQRNPAINAVVHLGAEDARAAARAVAVLAIADRESESALAARMGVTRMTVRKWLDKG